jgi:hypothetical protein
VSRTTNECGPRPVADNSVDEVALDLMGYLD